MKVIVRGIEFYGYHGVPDEERAVGHRYLADLEYEIDDRAGASDDLSDSVDYSAVVGVLIEAVRATQDRLLERLVRRCGERIMAEFPAIRSLRLTVAKRLPPMPFIVESVGVEESFFRA